MLSPTYLAADWRYADNDWQGANALAYTVYSVQPVFASDCVTITTPGTPMNLTGFTVQGAIYNRAQPGVDGQRYVPGGIGAPLPQVVGAVVDAVNGRITLSVPRTATIIPRQRIECWSNPDLSRLLAEPQIVDPSGNIISVGLQPLFVF
jgi:hypothetical protein